MLLAQNLPPATIPIVALVALIVLVTLIRGTRARSAGYAYHRKPLLSPWERTAFSTLARQLRPGQHLCPQVRLADLLAVTARGPNARQTALNRVASKSVDFVVVDIATGDARLVIELDDRSHDRPDRRDRDALVDAALRVAGIPIARFRPGQRIDLGEHLQASAFPQLKAAGSTRRLGIA